MPTTELKSPPSSIRLNPPVGATTTLPVFQKIELLEAGIVIASATWFTTGTDGLIQLLSVEVDSDYRRRGVGSRLFAVLLKEANLFFRSRGGRLRRVTACAEQKSHIIARAWLTHLGFHHVQTLTNTLKNQDVLVYLLGCD
jgi:ribosomal protein S18 acetylase RimI-like enzyme